jgi:uncharacterized membrane protein YraQ (UPF0718 family)
MSRSCHDPAPSCHSGRRFDFLLWGSLAAVAALYALHLSGLGTGKAGTFASAVYHIMNAAWPGMAAGVLAVALLSRVPKEFVMAALGKEGGVKGALRATLAGVLLDLCSHGILMVGAKLYERGASIGQVAAFLIASPWNSLSLTFLLAALIGLKWTLAFVALSALIAVITGALFDRLVARGALPANPYRTETPEGFRFWPEAKARLLSADYGLRAWKEAALDGIRESRTVLRWLLFGVVLAAGIRAFVDADMFRAYFGPSLLGLGMTLAAATVIEVCSEGSAPMAADLLTRARAPGNAFAFLMAGAATDYTEVMVLKETTKSWKIALFLPLLAVPQTAFIAWLINHFSV